ncbi:MAG: type II toxin-antitoxin system Phd/YefM family antitoxin [Caldilineaceae bacterium]|nr:type II toxin-antitoxin system Phd/YefM family antitoxin [Caldilineaceae bacterium]
MNKLPQIESISTMKHRYKEVIAKLDNGPVVLTQNSAPVGVLISPREWNQMVDEREDLEDLIALLKAELEVAEGEATMREVNPDTLSEELGVVDPLPA